MWINVWKDSDKIDSTSSERTLKLLLTLKSKQFNIQNLQKFLFLCFFGPKFLLVRSKSLSTSIHQNHPYSSSISERFMHFSGKPLKTWIKFVYSTKQMYVLTHFLIITPPIKKKQKKKYSKPDFSGMELCDAIMGSYIHIYLSIEEKFCQLHSFGPVCLKLRVIMSTIF